MSMINNNLLLTAAGSTSYQITRSLRFNGSIDNSYLSRTPSVAGNRKTFTWAGWIKRSKLSDFQVFFAAADASSEPNIDFDFNASDKLRIRQTTTGGTEQFQLLTTQVFRDCSAWYHFVIAVDTTQATASDRIKAYVNGSRITVFDTASYPSQNLDTHINNTTYQHAFGRLGGYGGYYFNGYLAECYLLDGIATDPSSFTTTDLTTGQLIPIAYTGTYGLVSVAAATGALPVYNTTDTYGATKGSGTRTDSNSSSIVLAIPMDGANNGTTFTDESATIKGSGSAKSITRNGDTKTLTAQSKFYGSSGYFDGTGDSLSIANSSDFTVNTYHTLEAWIYPTSHGAERTVFFRLQLSGAYPGYILRLDNGYPLLGSSGNDLTSAIICPLNTWSHVAWVFNNSGNQRIYVNGILGASRTNGPTAMDYSDNLYIGAASDSSRTFYGYIQDARVYRAEKYTSNFSPVVSYNNSFQLKFADNSSNTATTLGKDTSGNGNNFTPSNLSVTAGAGNDSLVDTPTNYGTDTGVGGEVRGNYATLSPLLLSDAGGTTSGTLSNGNLDYVNARNTYFGTCLSTIGVSSGKWYFEGTASGSSAWEIGIYKINPLDSRYNSDDESIGYSASGYGYRNNGNKQNNLSSSSYGATYTAADVIGVALDLDAGTLVFYKNGTSQGTAYSSLSGTYAFGVSASASGSGWSCNFGQRAFAYTAPSGFKALNTANLPAPLVTKPSSSFDVLLWSGNNASPRSLSGLSFSPDFAWIKARSNISGWNVFFDVIRGGGQLASNVTDAELAQGSNVGGYVSAYNSNGFTMTAGSSGMTSMNANNESYVAWCWDAGTTTVSNTQGSITSQVRANPTAGFSVVTYTGNATAGATVGHGLGSPLGLYIIKNRDAVQPWIVLGSAIDTTGANGVLILNSTAARTTSATTTATSSTTFPLSQYADVNGSGQKHVAYCFAPVSGYSSFGSYTGNGSTDGPFVFCNFRPRWILTKRTDVSGEWVIFDTARNTFNQAQKWLLPNTSDAEGDDGGVSAGKQMDILSNGFKFRGTSVGFNASGSTYIYAAFAESPFQYARAR
jgi:hypothetical protein